MDTSKDAHRIFNQLKNGLQQVSDAISPNSVQTRPEQIELLDRWQALGWSCLYHNQSNAFYGNSTNLFETELAQNQQHLRHHGFDLLHYGKELTGFVNHFLISFRIEVLQTLSSLEAEIKDRSERKPQEPMGCVIEGQGIPYESFHPTRYDQDQKRFVGWEKAHTKALTYHKKLESLSRDLNLIEQTIERYNLSQTVKEPDQPSTPGSTTAAPTQPKPKSKENKRSNNTIRKARIAVTYFDGLLEDIVTRGKGQVKPLSSAQVVKQAIERYKQAVNLNVAITQRGLNRYLKDIGKNQTALDYGGQVVQKLRQHN